MAAKKATKPKSIPKKIKAAPEVPVVAEDEVFCSPDNTPSQVVLVDAELKKLAAAYLDAWYKCDIEYIEQELPKLCARFLRAEGAVTALQRVKTFTDYVFKKKAASLNLPRAATDENLALLARVILPEIFSWPASDIADNAKDHDVKRGCDVVAAKLYLAIFTDTHFKRLASPNTGNTSKEQRQLLANAQAAQECLLKYLQAMVKCSRQHIVKIGEDMSIEIDGVAVETKGAARRALLALALMREKLNFTTTEFSQVYYGSARAQGETASEFTTAIRAVKKLVSGVDYESDNKGRRTVKGIYFVVQASDAQLKQAVAELLEVKKQ